MAFTITSADNGTNAPSGDGFTPGGNFNLTINGGTTIAAVLEKYNPITDSWIAVFDEQDRQNIAAAWDYPIAAGVKDRFRIAVTTATGTWGAVWSRIV